MGPVVAPDPIVRLEIRTHQGSLWQTGVVTGDGHVLSVAWNFDKARSVTVHTSTGVCRPTEGVVGYHFEGRVALLSVDWGDLRPVGLAIAEETPDAAARVTSVSVGAGFADQRRESAVTILRKRRPCTYEVSFPAQGTAPLPGTVLLDDQGRVVGLISAMAMGVVFQTGGGVPLPTASAESVRPEIAAAVIPGDLIDWERWRTERYPQLKASREASTRARALVEENRLADAWDQATRSRELDDRSSQSWLAVGLVLQGLRKWEDAADAYAKAVALTPTDATVCAAWAAVLVRTDRVDEAIAAVEKAVLLDPRSAYVHACRADVMTCARRWDDALASFDEALKRDPGNQKYRSRQVALIKWMVAHGLKEE